MAKQYYYDIYVDGGWLHRVKADGVASYTDEDGERTHVTFYRDGRTVACAIGNTVVWKEADDQEPTPGQRQLPS